MHPANWVLIILPKKVMFMKLADHLNNEKKQQLKKIKPPKKKHRQKEQFSTKDIEELMGLHKDV